METEKDNRIPFLDILIYRKGNGRLGHSVYRKPTHTDLYLNGRSHLHPSQKAAVMSTLIHRAKSICDSESLPKELLHLKKTFRQNGHNGRDISKALKRAFTNHNTATKEEGEKPIAFAGLPFVSTVSCKIARILKRHDIKTYFRPPAKLRNQLVTAKDPCGLMTPGVYQIPCECGQVYVGETGRTIATRMKEHQRHFRLGQPEKSAVAELSISRDHAIRWENTKVLCRGDRFWERLTKEAILIRTTTDTMNRGAGYALSNSWKPVLKYVSEAREKRREKADQS
ncbi:uncharacterized protein LOC124169501 [Ischnura elegans]|uniref:uncharacterized protein LOC124169501 n=1 Tax=Ischnura elegans TaxID=197161 RepID=UPI001ED8B205|nr:uncharacterized protein LOC124169501 [Ischnura elegans]